jgi:hypothetical protein
LVLFMKAFSFRYFLLLGCFLLAGKAQAIEPISDERGWGGFVLLGAGYTQIKSNTVVGSDLIDGDDNDTVASIDQKPTRENVVHPLTGLEIKYPFSGRNQIFLGGSLEDRLTLDFATQLGWRKQTQSLGSFQLGVLFSAIPVEVWEDPYLAGQPRNAVDRDSQGVRFEWARIMGSSFDLLLQVRDNDLDSELSGTDPALGCAVDCQQLLDRNGDQYQARLSYRFTLAPGHLLEPQLRLRREDRDGAAVSRDAWGLRLSYAYLQPDWTFVANAVYGQSSYDEANPLYGVSQDADTIALDAVVLYTLPMQSRRWQATGSIFWSEADSDIAFHDNKLSQVALGMIYNFGIR